MPCAKCGAEKTVGKCRYSAAPCGEYCANCAGNCPNCNLLICNAHAVDHSTNCGGWDDSPPLEKKRVHVTSHSSTAAVAVLSKSEKDKTEPEEGKQDSTSLSLAKAPTKTKPEKKPETPPYKDPTPWNCTITLLGGTFPVNACLSPGYGCLRGTIYHDVAWESSQPLIAWASRQTASTKQSGNTPPGYEQLLAMSRDGRAMRLLDQVLAGCSLFHHFYVSEQVFQSVFLERLLETVNAMLDGSGRAAKIDVATAAPWNQPVALQLVHLCGAMQPYMQSQCMTLSMGLTMRITGHHTGATFYGSAALIPACSLWKLNQLVTWFRSSADDSDQGIFRDLANLWCHVAELFAAWSSASVGCRGLYERFDVIDTLVYKLLKSIPPHQKPFAFWDDIFGNLILTRRWVTSCRRNLNTALRPVVQLAAPVVPGGRWDVVKDRCPVPENPYSDKSPISVGGAALEAYCAHALKTLPLFQPIRRYQVYDGPSLEQVDEFKKYAETINKGSGTPEQKEKLIGWIKNKGKTWSELVAAIDKDRLDAKNRVRDIRGFSSTTLQKGAQLYELCEKEDRAIAILLKAVLPIKGKSAKDGEYWDSTGFPWDQKMMFDPASIEGMSFEGAVSAFVGAVSEQAQDAAEGNIHTAKGDVCRKMGIVIDCTYVGPRVYECCWAGLYRLFDSGSVPYFDKGNPLIREVVAPMGSTVVTDIVALESAGIPGILFQFDKLLNPAKTQITFVNATSYLKNYVAQTLTGLVVEKLAGSWDTHRDYQDWITPPGLFCEVGFKYAKFEVAGRLLICRAQRRLYIAPLHYKRYVVPTTGISAAVRPSLFEVTFANQQETDSFWNSI